MKIAVVSESPADEAAIKTLVDAIVGERTELVPARVRPGGWPHVIGVLPNIVTALHYRGEADGLAVVVDSDDSSLHLQSHETQSNDPDCRLCQLRSCVKRCLDRVAPLNNRNPLQTALGLATPSIEAWYLCGLDPHVMEATWARKLLGEKITYDRHSLKVAVYGSNQPSLQVETAAAVSAAERLTDNIEQLEQLFPRGFGCFLADLRGWQ